MAINKKLIHFEKGETFDRELSNNNILDTSVVFIKDRQLIYTHGKIYKCSDSGSLNITIDESIVVEGGPLASLLKEAGINTIEKGTDLQSLLSSLFTKETWPVPVFTEGTITITITAPTITTSGTLVEVGLAVNISAIPFPSITPNTVNRKYTGFTYGYSSSNDNSKDNNNTSISITGQVSTPTTGKTITGTINSTQYGTGSSLSAHSFKAVEGNNVIKVTVSTPRYSATFSEIPSYYILSNLGHTSEDHKSLLKTSSTVYSSSTATQTKDATKTVVGVYPYFANSTSIDTISKLPLNSSTSIEISFPAETDTNKHIFKIPSKKNISVLLFNTLNNSWESYSIDKFVKSSENIDVQGSSVSYSVYTRNDGRNGASKFKIILS